MMYEKQPAFTIIVPVYNGATVIQQCIDSVLAQTYQYFELIVVDDGSKDATGPVCTQYTDQDKRVRYNWQENKGVSAARNYGLQLARNEFILFVDADDFLSLDALLIYSNLIIEEGVDKKVFIFQDFLSDIKLADGQLESRKWGNFSAIKSTVADTFRNLPTFNWLPYGVPFAKVFRLSILKANGITFNQRMAFKEDLIFLLQYLQYVENIVFDTNATYHYIIDKTKSSLSTTTASFDSEVEFFELFKELAEYYTLKFELSAEVQKILNESIFISFFRCINSCMYQYKIPMLRQARLRNIRMLATREHLRGLKKTGLVNNKMKQAAFTLLKLKQYRLYDLLNIIRYKFSG